MVLPQWGPTIVYTVGRDVSKWVTVQHSRGLNVTVDAHAQGPMTRISVTAQCRPGGQPVTVRCCRAERYPPNFEDACEPPEPVRERWITFLPAGPTKVRPGDFPMVWEAQVPNERLRRVTRDAEVARTIRVCDDDQAQKWLAELDLREQAVLKPPRNTLMRLVRAFDGPKWPEVVQVRAVLETSDGDVTTDAILVPPPPPLLERLEMLRTKVR